MSPVDGTAYRLSTKFLANEKKRINLGASMKPRKAKTVRIRPFEGDEQIAKMIAERTGLAMIDVMSFALQAGLRAIKENNYRFELPLEMKVVPFPERKDRPREAENPTGSSSSLAFPSETPPPYRTKGRGK